MINMKLLTANQAAEALSVSKATLYAYVSRGLLQSVEGPDRSRRYLWDDIERLRLRKVRPKEAATSALYGGMAALESGICTLAGGRCLYRGEDAVELSRSLTAAQMAAFLWTGDRHYPLAEGGPGEVWTGDFLHGALDWLNRQMERDLSGWDPSPEGMMRTGWKIYCQLRAQLPTHHAGLEQALMLCADHELNASTLAARVAASTGANLYAIVSAALCVLSGPRHGGACAQVEALVEEAARYATPYEALAQRLRRGEAIPGFGHPLYPQGDPRARELLQGRPSMQPWIEAGQSLLGAYPSLDFALVALGLPRGGGFACFATGRCLGWVAHALEQSRDPRMIRPRATLP